MNKKALKNQTRQAIIQAQKPAQKSCSVRTINNTVYSNIKHEINCIVAVSVQNLLDCGTILEDESLRKEMEVLEGFENKVFKNYITTSKSTAISDRNSLEFLSLSQEILEDMGKDYKVTLSFLHFYLNEPNPKKQKELNTPNGQRLKNAVAGLLKKLKITPEKYVSYEV